MQVTVTDYKTSDAGVKTAIDTEKIISIFNGNGVFDGRSREGWNVIVKNREGYITVFVDNDDVKLLRRV